MKNIKELISSPHIQIALAAGVSIILMAFFSKRVLAEPIGYLPLAIPPFIAAIHAGFSDSYQDSGIFKAWYWVTAIFAATAIIILAYML